MVQKVRGFCTAIASNPLFVCFVKSCQWIPVIFIVAVVSWGYYAYVILLCIFTIDSFLLKLVYLLLFHVLFVLFLWSYYQTIFSDIGKPTQRFVMPAEVWRDVEAAATVAETGQVVERFVRQRDLPITMRAYDGSIRYCEKCLAVKPDRSHHCSICGQCVLKFDHHCPWVNTCVNFNNYKFFVQFLGYAFAFCLWVFLTDIPYFMHFWKHGMGRGSAAKFHIMFIFFVSGMFSISVATLFFYHLWLSAVNRSTIESFRAPVFTYGPDKRGFNLGCRANLRQVFGPRPIYWFLPIFSSCGDGCAFDNQRSAAEAAAPRRLSISSLPLPPEPQAEGNGDGLSFPLADYEPEQDSLLNSVQRVNEQLSDDSDPEDDRECRGGDGGALQAVVVNAAR